MCCFFVAKILGLWYHNRTQKNKHSSTVFGGRARSGNVFGDKEIAVKVCGNSHYRN